MEQLSYMNTGNRGNYYWLESNTFGLQKLLKLCPAVIEDKYLIVAAYDGSPLPLSKQDLIIGWERKDQLAFSPRVKSADSIPCGEHDEWYVFPSKTYVNVQEIFVNDLGFALSDPSQRLDPTWDKRMHQEEWDIQSHKQSNFWRQMELLQPETYLAEGDKLIFVTESSYIYNTILRGMGNNP